MEEIIDKIAKAVKEFKVLMKNITKDNTPKTLIIGEKYLKNLFEDLELMGNSKMKGITIMGMDVISTPKQVIEVY